MLFLQQGVYKLLVAIGAVAGMLLLGREPSTGQVLLRYLAVFAATAGVTLLVTTHLYLGGALQLLAGLSVWAANART